MPLYTRMETCVYTRGQDWGTVTLSFEQMNETFTVGVWGLNRETNRLIAFILPSQSLKEIRQLIWDWFIMTNYYEKREFFLNFRNWKEIKRIDPNQVEKPSREKERLDCAFSQRVVEKLLVSLRAREKKLRIKE